MSSIIDKVIEGYGGTVEWNNDTQHATAYLNGRSVDIHVGDRMGSYRDSNGSFIVSDVDVMGALGIDDVNGNGTMQTGLATAIVALVLTLGVKSLVAAGSSLSASLAPALSPAAPEIGNKLEYVFGNATGSTHNIQRSQEMLSQLNSIGIFDNAAGREIVQNSLTNALNTPACQTIQANGRILAESLITGSNGVLKMQSVWEEGKLITVMLFGGQ